MNNGITQTTKATAGSDHTDQLALLALDARAVVRLAFGHCLSVRNWRSMDCAGKIPAGFKVGGRKLWRMRDLERWAHWEFPARPEFQRRLAELDGET